MSTYRVCKNPYQIMSTYRVCKNPYQIMSAYLIIQILNILAFNSQI